MFNFLRKTAKVDVSDWRNRTIAAFEEELRKRGVVFGVEKGTGRYQFRLGETDMAVSLDNLLKEVEADHDLTRVGRFVKVVMETSTAGANAISREGLFWCLEPNDHIAKADFCEAVSERVDRVLIHMSGDRTRLTWVSPNMLESLKMSFSEAAEAAAQNLARELSAAKIEFQEIDGVRLGFVNTHLPFKASLLLALNLRECVEGVLGWPLQAIAPDRNFLYLWAARHEQFVGRVGGVAVKEYTKAAYPLSTEVYSISEKGVRAIGAFPVEG